MFNKNIDNAAKTHAVQQFPNESVGIVVDNQYIPLTNTHKKPTIEFLVDEAEYLPYITKGTIQAVIHSHTHNQENKYPFPYPSQLDMETQLNWNVPFGITYTCNERASDIIYFGDTVPRKPLTGRFFVHGITDCYSLIRDYYNQTRGIWIKEFPRDWEWWKKGQKLYELGFEEAGFSKVPYAQAKEGDVIFMAVTPQTIREQNPCHAGIYLGKDLILHHQCDGKPYSKGSVSNKELIHRYTKYILFCARYTG